MKKVDVNSFNFTPFESIGKNCFLITAGNKMDGCNTMTAGWGTVGVMWYKNIAMCVVRPTRYTKEFMERNDYFTMSFMGDEYKDAIKFCGTNSGRKCDKFKETGLTPVLGDKYVYPAEATTVFVCKKIYVDKIRPECFLDRELCEKWYPLKDYHTAYIGEIEKILIK